MCGVRFHDCNYLNLHLALFALFWSVYTNILFSITTLQEITTYVTSVLP